MSKHYVKYSPQEALKMLGEANRCPDVSITETIALIQSDAYRAGVANSAASIHGLDAYTGGHGEGPVPQSSDYIKVILKLLPK